MKIKNFFKRLNYRHYIAIGLTVAFILLAVFVYNRSYIRLFESGRDVFTSGKYYLYELLSDGENGVLATVTEPSRLEFGDIFPIDFETFKAHVSAWWALLFSGENFYAYLFYASKTLLLLNVLLTFFVIMFVALKIILGNMIKTPNDNKNVDTGALKFFKRVERFFARIIDWIKSLFAFFCECKYLKIWLIIWLFNLNIITVAIETAAYLFYFVASFDIKHLYIQLYKFVCDLFITLSGLPWYIWAILAVIGLNAYRKHVGYNNLNHYENFDTGFARSLGIATMITAPMNGNKTKLATDLSLTFSKIFKYDARKTMRKCETEFKHFPFALLNETLNEYFYAHRLFSFATVERFIESRKNFFIRALDPPCGVKTLPPERYIWGYDFKRYGLSYDNELYLIDLFTMLEEYSKAAFIYFMPDSFIVSNYAIREDGIVEKGDNLPLWNFDFYRRKAETLCDVSYYSKILDFDILRKGKKVIENNPLSDTFEFGIVTITEFDKDRGNQLDTKGLKRDEKEANQLNDLFNYSPKMARHSATVDFNPYIRYIFDLQRAMKTEADIREICDCVLNVKSKDGGKLAMPMFFFEEFFYGLIYDRYADFLDEYDFYHSNNTLYAYLAKKIFGGFINYYRNVYNLFGYDVLKIDIQNGQLDGGEDLHDYYVMYKKAHSDRYATDCYGWFFRDEALKKEKGIVDYPAFGCSKATRAELHAENSYFIRALERVTEDKVD